MSVFSAVWTGVKTIFGANPEKGADMLSGVGSFIDESFYTEQEKSEAAIKVLDFKLKWMNATQGQNLARRYCAIMFGLNFIFTFQVGLMLIVYGHFTDIEPSSIIDCVQIATISDTKKVIDSIIELVTSFQLGWIMLAIIGFYFGKEFTSSNKK